MIKTRPAHRRDADEAPRCRHLTRDEFVTALNWSTQVGSHLGLDDSAVFWAADPEGWWGIELDGALVGFCGTIAHTSDFGSLAGPYVLPDLRGRGIGSATTPFFLQHLSSLLGEDHSITTDTSPGHRRFFEDVGFRVTQVGMRMSGKGERLPWGPGPCELRPLALIPFDEVEAYDTAHAGISRRDLIRRWIAPAGGLALAALVGGRIAGIGVIRPSREGYCTGPLVADTPEIAEQLLDSLCSHADGQVMALDVPESNSDALTLAASHGFRTGAVIVRMTRGPAPNTQWQQIYGFNALHPG